MGQQADTVQCVFQVKTDAMGLIEELFAALLSGEEVSSR